MATCRTNDPYDIQMDSASEDDSTMEIDEVYSSETDSSETDDEIATSKEQSADRIWKKTAFKPHLFSFDDTNAGLSSNINAMKDATPLEFFQLLFDESIVDLIVEKTNKYQRFSNNNTPPSPSSHQAKWTETNRSEIYTFLATIMLMSVTKKNKILDYWSTDPMIITPIFGQLFPRDRFLPLLKYLHFNDESTLVNDDKLYKIKPVINSLRKKFKSLVIPNKNLCIDESLILWKGRLAFKQYIPSKRRRFGIKVFVICDCQTGAVLDFIVYTGLSTDIDLDQTLGKSGSIVLTLMKPYLNKGHSVFLDNWYTSSRLFEKLHELKTGACGTVRRNRVGPVKLDKLRKGDFDYNNTNNLMVLKWQDKREVIMLCTIHKPIMIETQKSDWRTQKLVEKPECIVHYNRNMGSVDKTDMQISFVECLRKTIKWYKKFFFHLLDLSTFNAYILFKVKHKKSIPFGDFRRELIRQLIESYSQPRRIGGRPITNDNPIRLTARHFPSQVPATATQKNAQRDCIVCSRTNRREKKRKKTRYQCDVCDVGLCVIGCFEDYHTLKHF
ncbi:unnamed protein product [Adineta steineri]|uniref:PiggyBac transposable element-derived protein 4-like n=1 Tax=Adineta steineri TaxID=433720 RepID=A0A815MAT4_9BILA|nr:unnamed protein product [Adineta steineri]CAF3863979.1 unnamed protein product [Adineta steineri]